MSGNYINRIFILKIYLIIGYKQTHLDNICDRLHRAAQNRENRTEMINKLFRKQGKRFYRFSESILQKRISQAYSV